MKRRFMRLFAACLSTAILSVLPAGNTVCAEELEYGGMKYEITDNGITITGRTDALPTELVIPSHIGSLPVTKIGAISFSGCKTLTSVVIPDTVTEIGNTAFYGTDSLESITIPESVTTFGSSSFGASKWLALQREISPLVIVNRVVIDGMTCTGNVTLPSGIVGIGQNAFNFDRELTGITIPEGVTYIDNAAFYSCTALTEINLPDSLKQIGLEVLSKCPALESVTIPPNLERLDSFSIRECTALKFVTIPATITKISPLAIYECDDVTICGYTGSAAETYAKKNNIPFSALDPVETTTVTTASTLPEALRGMDLDGNGEISMADAVLLIRFVGEDSALTDKQVTDILNAGPDQDSDGFVTAADVTALLEKLAAS